MGCVSKLEGLSLVSVHTAAHRTIYSITPGGLHGERLTQGKAGNRKHRAGLADTFGMEISNWLQCFLDNFIDTHR